MNLRKSFYFSPKTIDIVKRSFFSGNRLISPTKRNEIEKKEGEKIPTNSVNVAIFCQIHPNLSLFAGGCNGGKKILFVIDVVSFFEGESKRPG